MQEFITMNELPNKNEAERQMIRDLLLSSNIEYYAEILTQEFWVFCPLYSTHSFQKLYYKSQRRRKNKY